MSSIALSEKNLKEKWLRNYQEEIYTNKEKREGEVVIHIFNKIKQTKFFIFNLFFPTKIL